MGPDTDSFADNLKLPENVKLEYPKALQTRTTAETITELGLDQNKEGEFRFQLYNSFQPGLYEYDLWISSEKNGSVYLKAFEIIFDPVFDLLDDCVYLINHYRVSGTGDADGSITNPFCPFKFNCVVV